MSEIRVSDALKVSAHRGNLVICEDGKEGVTVMASEVDSFAEAVERIRARLKKGGCSCRRE